MKKVLVISDNPLLTHFFQKECELQKIEDSAVIQYRYSPVNRNPSPMIALGAVPIDLKDKQALSCITNNYNLIISLHCKQIFPSNLVKSITCINIHPGYNPYNRGWFPQVFSIINSKPIGATIHVMDENIDHGPIIEPGISQHKNE